MFTEYKLGTTSFEPVLIDTNSFLVEMLTLKWKQFQIKFWKKITTILKNRICCWNSDKVGVENFFLFIYLCIIHKYLVVYKHTYMSIDMKYFLYIITYLGNYIHTRELVLTKFIKELFVC